MQRAGTHNEGGINPRPRHVGCSAGRCTQSSSGSSSTSTSTHAPLCWCASALPGLAHWHSSNRNTQAELVSWAVSANVSATLWTALRANAVSGRATDENGTSLDPDFWGWDQYKVWEYDNPGGVLVRARCSSSGVRLGRHRCSPARLHLLPPHT